MRALFLSQWEREASILGPLIDLHTTQRSWLIHDSFCSDITKQSENRHAIYIYTYMVNLTETNYTRQEQIISYKPFFMHFSCSSYLSHLCLTLSIFRCSELTMAQLHNISKLSLIIFLIDCLHAYVCTWVWCWIEIKEIYYLTFCDTIACSDIGHLLICNMKYQ